MFESGISMSSLPASVLNVTTRQVTPEFVPPVGVEMDTESTIPSLMKSVASMLSTTLSDES